jgi:hypothetical protein
LPHVLKIEIWIEIFVCRVDLQLLALDQLFRPRNLRILRFRRSPQFLIGIREWCFAQVGGFYAWSFRDEL